MQSLSNLSVDEVYSPQESIQSSIIMPRFTYKDTIFASVDIYGVDLKQITTSNVITRISLPASNRTLLENANVFQGLGFAVYRYILSFFFLLYSYHIQGLNLWQDWLDFIVSMTWWIISLSPFIPEDLSMKGDDRLDVAQSSLKGSIFSRVYNSPITFGNYVISQSLKNITHPRSRLTIRRSMGNFLKPKHMAIILEMNVLAIKQPPEVPIPYLDAEKKLVLPDKKEVGKNLTQRAEWGSAHHVHKASETIRIVYESAKIIAWSACSKINLITIHEINGYAWKDLDQLSNLVQEEMKNLTRERYMVNDFIKIVDLDSNNEIIVLNNEAHIKGINLNHLEPTPELGSSTETIKGNSFSTPYLIGGGIDKFSTNLTVLLSSGLNVNTRSGIKNEIGMSIRSIFGVSIASDYIVHPEDCVNGYSEPEVLIKYCGPRQQFQSLNGFPLVNQKGHPVVIEYSSQPVSFKAIRRGIECFDKSSKQ